SSSSPLTGERIDHESGHALEMTFNTNIRMMTSAPVIRKVITALKLDTENNNKDLEVSFIKGVISQLKTNIKLLLNKNDVKYAIKEINDDKLQNRKMQNLIASMKNKISVGQIMNTRLLNLSVKDKDPEFATNIANTLAKEYMEFTLVNKIKSSQQALKWLNNELYDLRKKLEDDEKKFFEYKQKNEVFSISGKQKLAVQKIQEFNSNYLETRNKRLGLDAKINELNKNINGIKGVANVRYLINNPMIENIYAKMVNLEIELTRLLKVYKAKHPKIVQARGEIKKAGNQLALEIKKERDNLSSERKVLYAKETTLQKTISEFETDAIGSSGKELKYTILQRNMNTSQNLYDLMVSRIKESKIMLSTYNASIRIVETAQIPTSPVSPNKKKNLLMGIILGMACGIGLAFFLEYFDQTIRTEENIQDHLDMPILSVIPKADKSVSYGEYQ
ncbi:MAG: GumC family protein, partial [Desulfobacteraceae bacterium]|nr:GumC family protein [Desulfobacteraceae bacterium]